MVPLLKFYFHEEVRQAAVQAVPELLKSVYMAVSEGKANGADMQYVKQMLDYVWQPLIDSMVKVSVRRQNRSCLMQLSTQHVSVYAWHACLHPKERFLSFSRSVPRCETNAKRVY